MKFTKIPADTFKQIQLNAGIILTDFKPEEGSYKPTDILGATSGGVGFSATPEFVDFGEDIDNCPKNMKELKKLDKWTVTMSGNFVTVTPDMIAFLIGAADPEGEKVVPRNDVLDEDFKDLWWVGDYGADNSEESGGFLAIHIINSLSTGGFQLQSTDKNKSQFAFEFTGHYSMKAQETVPFEIYLADSTAED